MKNSLLTITAITLALTAQNSEAADMYSNQYSTYGQPQNAQPQQYGTAQNFAQAPQQQQFNAAPQSYATANPYQQQFAAPQQYSQQQYAPQYPAANNGNANTYNAPAYNNLAPAAGPDLSRFPFWYVGLGVGMAFNGSDDWERGAAGGELDTDSGVSYSLSVGYKPSNFRYEVEAGYTDRDVDFGTSTGSVQASKLMGNVLYDFDANSLGFGISPFLGAGLGFIKADIDPTNPAAINGGDTAPAYQLIAGASVNDVMQQVDVSLAYKFLDTFGDLKEDGAKFEYGAHAIEAGARLRF